MVESGLVHGRAEQTCEWVALVLNSDCGEVFGEHCRYGTFSGVLAERRAIAVFDQLQAPRLPVRLEGSSNGEQLKENNFYTHRHRTTVSDVWIWITNARLLQGLCLPKKTLPTTLASFH